MSTKLNAEEFAIARQSRSVAAEWTGDMEWAYATAIREVAQPIAYERDDLRKALKRLLVEYEYQDHCGNIVEGRVEAEHARASLVKYPKP